MGVDDERRHAILSFAVDLDADFREYGEEIRVAGVGDPDLGAAEEVVRAVVAQHGARLHRLSVGTGAWLRQAECRDQLARRAARQVALLLVVGAEKHYPFATDRLVCAEVDAERRISRADFSKDAIVDFGRRPEPAVRLGDTQAHDAELVQPLPHTVRKLAVVIELG